ncbi:MAG: DinB family protein [Acidobacteriia bacterium]|nr:DinB family protein [Terriglobia bacterium]
MDTSEHERYFEIVKQTPERLTASLKGVPRKLLLWTPSPGKWSIQEIVCHMRDMERDAYIARYRRILDEENPTLKNIDGDAYALESEYRRMKLSDVLRDWKRLRKDTLKLLKSVKDEQWERAGVHETDGPLTLEIVLRRQAVGNDEAHLGQIEHIKVRNQVLQKFEEGGKRIESEVRGVSEEVLRRKPSPGEWSIMEFLAHLADTEQVFLTRYVRIANADKPALAAVDSQELAVKLRYNERDLTNTLKEFKRLRADTLTLLRALPQKSWQRTGIDAERGEITIEGLAKVHTDHDSTHADEIRALKEKSGKAQTASA